MWEAGRTNDEYGPSQRKENGEAMKIELSKDTWEEVLSLVRYGEEVVECKYGLTLAERQAAQLLRDAYLRAVGCSGTEVGEARSISSLADLV